MTIDAIKGIEGSVAVLDIGTNKVACFIAVPDERGNMQVTGIGHQLSQGIKSGLISDISEAQTSIVAAVHAAEQMAEASIEHVIVNLENAQLYSHTVSVELDISNDAVNDQDIIDIIHEGCKSVSNEEHTIIHCFPVHYRVDDSKGLKDPRGMIGEVLLADLHVIVAKNAVLKNLSACIARCHLNIAGYVAGSHAAALACLQPDERDLGVTLIDIGAGTTSISTFVQGKNIFTDVLPVGGIHITHDIAAGLSTSLSHAERLKTLHGTPLGSNKDEEMMIEVPQLGEEEEEMEPTRMSRAMLVEVVRPRVEELFEMVRNSLEASGVDKAAGRRCVITGGASQMIGMADVAARILNKQVRIGRPRAISGLPDSVSGPAFSAAVGMLVFTQKLSWEEALLAQNRTGNRISFTFRRLVQWVRENF